jgi:hypothetical protein
MRRCFFACLVLAAVTRFGFPPLFADSYLIVEEELVISGRTRPEAVRRIFPDAAGSVFSSRAELDGFIEERDNLLEDTRQFESVEITARFGEPEPEEPAGDGAGGRRVPVALTVAITDGAAFIPIPFAIYNSNAGFMSGLFVNMPNFMGRFQHMMAIAQYNAYPDSRDELQWLNPNYEFGVVWSGIRAGDFRFDFAAFFGKNNNPTEVNDETMIKTRALTYSFSASAGYEITRHIANRVSLGVSGAEGQEILEELNPAYRVYNPVRIAIRASDTVSYTDIAWEENFRKGISAALSVGDRYYMPYFERPWNQVTVSASFAAFGIFKQVNPTARISAEYATGNPALNMADGVRGVRDARFAATGAVYLNTGVQCKLFRAGQTEIHINPLIDAALFFGTASGDARHKPEAEHPVEAACGIGAEFIIFNDRMKSMPIKLGVAYGIYPVNGTFSKRFEIDLNFTFTY